MSNIDQASLRAVERAVADKSYKPKDQQTLSELIAQMEDQSAALGHTIAHAKKVLALILGGLK